MNGTLEPNALNLIKRLGSYTEISPSGTGAHVLIEGKLPCKGRRSGKIEMYDSGRYFTITGEHLSGTPLTIHNRQAVLEELSGELFPLDVPVAVAKLSTALTLSDEELIERAKKARNGERFRRLWAGDASDYSNEHSRADLALCRILAFWCGQRVRKLSMLAQW